MMSISAKDQELISVNDPWMAISSRRSSIRNSTIWYMLTLRYTLRSLWIHHIVMLSSCHLFIVGIEGGISIFNYKRIFHWHWSWWDQFNCWLFFMMSFTMMWCSSLFRIWGWWILDWLSLSMWTFNAAFSLLESTSIVMISWRPI
jgi:hypothetical protein